ncbi:MAG TPA: hypothetical protein VGG48_11550 [Rhizomicrobium sp.]|jgi:hypothetical protein
MKHVTAVMLTMVLYGAANAQGVAPVKSCTDARTYIGADGSMTMDDFRKLMTAAGHDPGNAGNHALDNECKVAPYVGNNIMVQSVLLKDDGTVVSVATKVIIDNGVCKLTQITLSGC